MQRLASALIAACLALVPHGHGYAASECPVEREVPLVPQDMALCASLAAEVRKPSALPLDTYEDKLATFLRNFCHRDTASGWKSDKRLRDTGPFIGAFHNGKWTGNYHGTHAPVVTWYSPDMVAWLEKNRPEGHEAVNAPAEPAPVPDGAIMVKEMFPPPVSRCADVDMLKLFPQNGAAIMVRDAGASFDGWFWGWFGWAEGSWAPDWPATQVNAYPNMGFGLYCTNCHSSARDNQTFASLRNIAGEPGEPLAFLSHDFFLAPHFETEGGMRVQRSGPVATRSEEPFLTHHEEIVKRRQLPLGLRTTRPYSPAFADIFRLLAEPAPASVRAMPSETYDHVWFPAGDASAKSQFVTSGQCLGCHSAGGTGLQFHMTEPTAEKLANISPYSTWRHSPMGMSGRDPIFFAQLASETETFHPESSAFIQDTCLGCHAVQGQRQHKIDRHAESGECDQFSREMLDAVPYQADDAVKKLAHYAALGRDGVSCNTCHAMVLSAKDMETARDEPQNACVAVRQERMNPGLKGLASTFTGSFLVAAPGKMFGPYDDLRDKPMKAATGVVPEHAKHVKSSEMCASCHTVHLPVLHRGKTIGHTYEQATYPEWAFSAYRTGETADGVLPHGPGAKAQSCQGCHMPSKDARGRPLVSKIASIQEYSNFPAAEYTLPPKDIDLSEREGFAKHTLVGLNMFLVKMARQFPQVLGIRTEDPMLPPRHGTEPLEVTEAAILDQAARSTAEISIGAVQREGDALNVEVKVENKAGHKFPSGVAFRRAFVEFSVLDKDGKVLWASGRTNGAGVIVDGKDAPVAGELWWQPDCSARIEPEARAHQPHHQTITRQDQAQIYQELTAAPPDTDAPVCGVHGQSDGQLTTSFLSICSKAKDNRLLPHGFLPLDARKEIAASFGAKPDLAEEVAPSGVGDDPDYAQGGGDATLYRVPLAELGGEPATVRASLYYQATPPYYLQDRFCTSNSEDTKRLYYVAGKLDVSAPPIKDWKLQVGQTAEAPVP